MSIISNERAARVKKTRDYVSEAKKVAKALSEEGLSNSEIAEKMIIPESFVVNLLKGKADGKDQTEG